MATDRQMAKAHAEQQDVITALYVIGEVDLADRPNAARQRSASGAVAMVDRSPADQPRAYGVVRR
jgi:hypothetical protein